MIRDPPFCASDWLTCIHFRCFGPMKTGNWLRTGRFPVCEPIRDEERGWWASGVRPPRLKVKQFRWWFIERLQTIGQDG